MTNVIGLRAYVSSIEGTVVISNAVLIHEEVLFRLIAFRALLMCTLPISTSGVTQVARVFPKYLTVYNHLMRLMKILLHTSYKMIQIPQ